ncbi:reverse transcriptase domain-containing protein [Tanacetum coccineum]
MPSHIKTYDESEDPEDHLKIFQVAAKMECWAMPTWCHMFNFTLTGNARVWFDDLPQESINSYDDLKKAFLENYLQQKKCIKDPVKIHNIKQRDGESMEEFMQRYKFEYRDVKGAPECMKISRFMHGITNPELIKRLHDKIPNLVDKMMRVTISFLIGEVTASNREWKKSFPSWKQQEAGQKQNFKKRGFRNQQRPEQKQDRFTLLTKTPKKILALDKGKFKPPPRMTTQANRGNAQSRKDVTSNQRVEAKQWERSGKGNKKRGNLRKGQAVGDTDGTTMAEGSQTKDYSNFLSGVSNFFSASRGGRWDGGFRPEIGDEEHSTSAWKNFMVVRSPCPYNGIIGRLGVRRIRAVPSTAHGMLKFSVTGRTITLQSSSIIPLECTMVSGPRVSWLVINQVIEEKIQVAIHPEYPEQTIATGSTLTEERRKELCAEHRLNIHEGCLPVRQNKRGQAPKRNKAIYEEVEKLVDAEIDWKVESLYGYMFKCFLDAYKGYHQIQMAKEDEENTTFITSQVDKAFQKQFGRNLEVYVDDLVIKIRTEQEVIRDIEETFKTLRGINMKLNPKKYAFGMREVTFLGYKVNADRLRVCPDKVEAVLNLPSPKCLKDVQKLNGKLASLNRFLSKSPEKSLPFFKTLKKPRTSVKGQILADFIVERSEDDSSDTPMEDKEELPDPWVLFTDGSSCIDGSGAGLIITNPEGIEFTYALRFRFNATNNEAEYEALIAGLWIAEQIGVKNLQANVDSRLVANQVNGIYIAKEPGMIKYLEKQVLVEELKEKSIDEKEVLAVVEEEERTWLTPIYKYLTEEILLEEKRRARAIRCKAGSNGETPFSLTYGTEAVIPVEIGMPTLRTAEVDMIKNDEALEINLDLLEERREQAAIQEAKSKAKMEKYYNARVPSTSFRSKQAVRKMEASLDLNGKDHMKSRKH